MNALTMNCTDRAREAADLIGETCFESHRGAMPYWKSDTAQTVCIALYGNDGYTKKPDSDPEIHARTIAYVGNLYAGLANLLPEGAVEFGTDEGGYTWVILAHFPRPDNYLGPDDVEEDDDEDVDEDPLVAFWNDIVWEQWKSQLSFATE